MTEPQKKIYFASDFHLGVPNEVSSRKRELEIIAWLNQIQATASDIFLVGDIFDFWFEYRYVAPKGFVRLLGKIAELSDAGIKVHFFTGNHDMWMFNYLEEELGVKIHRSNIRLNFNGKHFLIGHGDGLGPGDYQYKFLKNFFASSICQWLFARIHPNLGFGIARFWSGKSRIKNNKKQDDFTGAENEWLFQYCKEILATESVDYFVFGHRHLPLELSFPNHTSKYINLGEWFSGNPHYAVFDGEKLELKKWLRS